MEKKLDKIIRLDVEAGKMKIKVKDRCFVCGCKIKNSFSSSPLARYLKQGNTCDECSACSSFSRSSVPEKAGRYKRWCLRLDLLQDARNKKLEKKVL